MAKHKKKTLEDKKLKQNISYKLEDTDYIV